MKIVETEGCIVSGITIDGIDIHSISEEQRDKIFKWMESKMIEDRATFYDMLSNILSIYGDYKYLYTCEQCGDSVSETTLEI